MTTVEKYRDAEEFIRKFIKENYTKHFEIENVKVSDIVPNLDLDTEEDKNNESNESDFQMEELENVVDNEDGLNDDLIVKEELGELFQDSSDDDRL